MARIIVRQPLRRRMPRMMNIAALAYAGVVLFTPKLDGWQASQFSVLLFGPASASDAAR